MFSVVDTDNTMCFSPFLQPQVLFTTNEPQSYVFGGRNHPLHINSQKRILEAYAKQNGFSNLKWYTDDGFSGANFQRPGFQSMLADIEAGLVGTVIVKDMSRLGRNYLQVGMYTEMIFPQNGVRFIAINDGVDSAQGENDFAPLRNIFKNTRHLGGVNC